MWSFIWLAVASASIIEYSETVQPSTLRTVAREGIYVDNSTSIPYIQLSRNHYLVNIHNLHDKNATLAVLIGSKDELAPILTSKKVSKSKQLKSSCENNQLNVPESLINSGVVSLFSISSSTVLKTVLSTQERRVKESNLIYSMLIYCGEYDVEITGTYVGKSYYGYLPGEDYYLMKFSLLMCGVYMLTAVIWGISLIRYYNTAIFVQKYLIPCILIMGLIEYGLLYLDYDYHNNNGNSEWYLFITGVFFNALRNSLARAIVLGVSLGWGITKPGLGGSGVAISVIAIMYFIFDMGYEIAIRYSTKHSVSLTILLLSSLPIVVLNSLICVWILISLYAQLKKLKQERQEIKHKVMLRLAIILAGSSGLCLILTFIESCIKLFSYYDSYWTLSWIFIAVWHILFYLTLICIMILWRIDENSLNLAFSDQLYSEDMELSYEEEEK